MAKVHVVRHPDVKMVGISARAIEVLLCVLNDAIDADKFTDGDDHAIVVTLRDELDVPSGEALVIATEARE
jgi:hypothetical protein